jgi:transposase
MERYVGIDAHAASCTLAVVGASGKRLRSIVVDTNGRALVEAVKGIGGRLHVCLEEGTHSAWLYELLEPHAAEVVVTVPPETRGQKSDVRDAWSRAEELRTGAIRTRVYKAPVHFMALHTAVRAQLMATRDLTRAKNRLKAVWRSRGMMPDSAVYSAQKREAWLKRLPPPHALLAQWLARQIEALEPLRDDAEAWLDREAKTHPIIRKLSTTPGLGTVRTAQVVAIVADPHRFRTRQQFWSYCGLGIVTRSSSDWVRDQRGQWLRAETHQTRGLSRKRNSVLKAVFKGAATTVITKLVDHPLHAAYQRMLEAGIKPNLAKLTLARRIAAIVLSMWKHKEVYDPQRQATPAKV